MIAGEMRAAGRRVPRDAQCRSKPPVTVMTRKTITVMMKDTWRKRPLCKMKKRRKETCLDSQTTLMVSLVVERVPTSLWKMITLMSMLNSPTCSAPLLRQLPTTSPSLRLRRKLRSPRRRAVAEACSTTTLMRMTLMRRRKLARSRIRRNLSRSLSQ